MPRFLARTSSPTTRRRTVTFKVTDKANNGVDIRKLTRIRVVLGGNNVDYGVAPGMMNATFSMDKVHSRTQQNCGNLQRTV